MDEMFVQTANRCHDFFHRRHNFFYLRCTNPVSHSLEFRLHPKAVIIWMLASFDKTFCFTTTLFHSPSLLYILPSLTSPHHSIP
jgi:hypothetical protein